MLKRGYILLLFVLAVSIVSIGQKKLQTTAGTFLIQNYSPKDYQGNPQIFGIRQDSRGVIYVANQTGVLEYDGVSWRTIPVGAEGKKVLSIEKDYDGSILVAAEGEFGKLIPDSTGQLEFRSLLGKYGIENVGRVTQMFLRNDGYILKTKDKIYILEEGKDNVVIEAESEIGRMFLVGKDLFVTQNDLGLFRVVENKFMPVKEGYTFSNKEIVSIVRFGERNLIITQEHGLYEIDSKDDIRSLNLLEDITAYSIGKSNGLLSIGTFSQGIIALDKDLNVVYKIGIEKGIIDATIKAQYFDTEGNLWLGTNVGLSKLSINEPVQLFNKKIGVKGAVESISKFNGGYYIATLNGLYLLKDAKVTRIDGISKDCFGVRPYRYKNDSMMLISELDYLYSHNSKGELKIVESGGPYDFRYSPKDSSELIVLHYNGLAKLKYDKGNFIEKAYVRDFSIAETFNLVVEENGFVWIGTKKGEGQGVYRIHVDSIENENPKFDYFNTESGLPKGPSYLFLFEKEIYCGTDKGVFKFQDGRFEIYNDFGFDFSNGAYGVHRINANEEGNIWMVIFDSINNYQIGYSYLVDDKYVWTTAPFRRYSDELMHAIYHDTKGVSWLGGPNGVFRYNKNIDTKLDVPYQSVIRSVTYGNEKIFNGIEIVNENGKNTQVSLNYSSNKAIGFEFSSTSFIDEKLNEFSYFLEGKEEGWSKWSKRTVKEYNLDHGKYIFHVKARNVYGTESSESIFEIIIHPPWYQTTWAYVLYFIAFVVFVFVVIKLSIRRIKLQNIRLEALVDERTIEVVVQKEEAEKQRDFANEQQKIAERQRELVEEKNKEILDSIAYAKRLQDAILPPDKLVNDKLPNSFILYKPKDIVAGDFYWMESVDEKEVLFAAADCTGHGVPGAMVSVVCSNALDRTVKEFGYTNTGKVLDKVTDLVIETFEKSEDEVKDGMDISLCKMRYEDEGKKAVIQYSGANNPLWIISSREDIGYGDTLNLSEGGFHLHEVKATKQPVGQYAERRPFEVHDLVLEKGDIFYLFTDGFADQFGGSRGKKYKYKTFKRYLLANAEVSMKEQKGIIDTEFEKWKGDFEQVDDVCIIGVRI